MSRKDPDVIRLDLADKDKAYVDDVLGSFVTQAHRYGRKLVAIRMSESIARLLGIASGGEVASYAAVAVVLLPELPEDTVEVLLAPLQ